MHQNTVESVGVGFRQSVVDSLAYHCSTMHLRYPRYKSRFSCFASRPASCFIPSTLFYSPSDTVDSGSIA